MFLQRPCDSKSDGQEASSLHTCSDRWSEQTNGAKMLEDIQGHLAPEQAAQEIN
jgi:hypothetical protein